jgi:hypothetical protein
MLRARRFDECCGRVRRLGDGDDPHRISGEPLVLQFTDVENDAVGIIITPAR